MPETTDLGDITIVVGHYPDPSRRNQETGQPLRRNRSRRIGNLLRTTHSDGSSRYWLKLNGDALNSSLLMLALRATGKTGDDAVIANVFAKRDATPPAAGGAAPPAEEEDPEGDPIPF